MTGELIPGDLARCRDSQGFPIGHDWRLEHAPGVLAYNPAAAVCTRCGTRYIYPRREP